MNGVHDMGGMHGFGPVRREDNEAVFHAPWEGRVYAMNRALGAWGKWNLDSWRHDIELLPPEDYLRSYYERWLLAMEKRIVKHGMVSAEELASGKADAGAAKLTPPFRPQDAAAGRGIPLSQDSSIVPRFSAGQQVRARNIHPTGHTPSALRARQDRTHRPRSRRLRVPRHERARPRRAPSARVLGSLRSARALGRCGLAHRLRLHRSMG